MLDKELQKLKTLARRNKQIMEILVLKVPYGDLAIYERMHLEMFLKNIRTITENIERISDFSDVLLVKDLIRDLETGHNNEEKRIIASILEMLDMMTKSLIYSQKANFYLVKKELINMLEINTEELIKDPNI